ncbi:hypothetical protein, variant [Aphanomyces astaci]|uniref:Uncharacterized protein n=1 Tax=Aphanomyces astaci TaxID=112090 RepID=W4GWG1_APHAT|nr:hypothetical protein H257_04020 [Aphanomyces astaci]XP_009826678.1 hypothetical protein, variant [Aphanomyces astaci]ETV83247.1 hypothetical protein H257_04020 [Aphanomyces astaci]ETV83248.1 hypothetical protein, variant [Aphanomyces astaci]|eukprot:XP_009826677.1 hypothetical protein H257_04020 [Aphanomyces astaci]
MQTLRLSMTSNATFVRTRPRRRQKSRTLERSLARTSGFPSSCRWRAGMLPNKFCTVTMVPGRHFFDDTRPWNSTCPFYHARQSTCCLRAAHSDDFSVSVPRSIVSAFDGDSG